MPDIQTITITFTLEEVNSMLQVLGEIPAKYSLDLVQFIRSKAKEQTTDSSAPVAS